MLDMNSQMLRNAIFNYASVLSETARILVSEAIHQGLCAQVKG